MICFLELPCQKKTITKQILHELYGVVTPGNLVAL
eukprot:UN03392